MDKMNEEDKAEHARLIGGEITPRKRRGEAPVKVCVACYQLNYRAARICCGCFRTFYPSKAKNNDENIPLSTGILTSGLR
jgi:hypothetical protein